MTMANLPTIRTPITEMFGIKHPILLAGMNVAAGPDLCAAVTNAGGLGVFGGVNYTPKMFQIKIDEIKEGLNDKSAPFGVDLLLPQVGGNARKTNHDYTHGDLAELIDITIASGAKLFVSAVGVPPKFAVDKLHAAGIPNHQSMFRRPWMSVWTSSVPRVVKVEDTPVKLRRAFSFRLS